MGSINEEITRLQNAKILIESAIEECGVNVPEIDPETNENMKINKYADYISFIPSAVLSSLNVDLNGGTDQFIQSIKQTNGLIEATIGGIVNTSSSGLVPKIGTSAASTISTLADEWVLTSTKGEEPTWRKLPSVANALFGEAGTSDVNRHVWFSHATYENKRCYDNDFMYNPSTNTLTVTNVNGNATFATTLGTSSAGYTYSTLTTALNNKSNVNHTHDSLKYASDTRSVATIPSDYKQILKFVGIKTGATMGLTDSFVSVIGWKGYTDQSGPKVWELASGNSRLYVRPGTWDADSWGNWNTIAYVSDFDWNNITNKPTSFAPTAHNHTTAQITALTSYAKATTAGNLETTDSLNTALGKLEFKADTAYSFIAATMSETDDSNTTIDRLKEVFDVLSGITETDTIKALVGKYLLLAGGKMTGDITPTNNNTLTLGTSNLKWNAVYATTFYGALSGNASSASKLGSSTLGSTTKPIYLNSGTATECSTYAGGTAVTLNGTSKAATTASFYAPTSAGTSGYVLKSNGLGAPTWANPSTLTVGLTNDLKGGAVGSIPYQNAKNSTVFLEAPTTNGYVLKYNTTNKTPYWAIDIDTTYNVATQLADGLMSSADKTKLDGIIVTVNSGTSSKLAYYSSANTIDDYTSTKGSATKGIYLNRGVPTEMTYSLSSTVNSGTSSRLAYYSGTNAISSYTIPNSVGNLTTVYVLGSYSSAVYYSPNVTVKNGTTLYASGGFFESSDNKLKNFKENIEINFEKLKQLPKKYFTWKSDETDKLNIGTSAQELQKLYPELVSKDENGLLHVAYDKLSIIALSAIDKLYEEVCELKSIINSLQNK